VAFVVVAVAVALVLEGPAVWWACSLIAPFSSPSQAPNTNGRSGLAKASIVRD
jgi:hypothetical protein